MLIVISWYWNINQMSKATLIQHVDNICNIDIRYLARVRPSGHRQPSYCNNNNNNKFTSVYVRKVIFFLIKDFPEGKWQINCKSVPDCWKPVIGSLVRRCHLVWWRSSWQHFIGWAGTGPPGPGHMSSLVQWRRGRQWGWCSVSRQRYVGQSVGATVLASLLPYNIQ